MFHDCKPWIEEQGECAFAKKHEDERKRSKVPVFPDVDLDEAAFAQKQEQEKPYETATIADVEAFLRGERRRGSVPKPVGTPERRPELEPVGVPRRPELEAVGSLLHPYPIFRGELAVELITAAAITMITMEGAAFTGATLKGAEALAARYAGSGGRAVLGAGAGVASWMTSMVGGRKRKREEGTYGPGGVTRVETSGSESVTDYAARFTSPEGNFLNLQYQSSESTTGPVYYDLWSQWVEGYEASDWADQISQNLGHDNWNVEGEDRPAYVAPL